MALKPKATRTAAMPLAKTGIIQRREIGMKRSLTRIGPSVIRIGGVSVVLIAIASCGTPGVASLRDSFAQQLASNKFIKDFKRTGDDLTFSGPGAEGGEAKWRVHIDSATVEPNTDQRSNAQTQPYKGVVKSSWYSDGRLVRPRGSESNLPIELISNGLGQECWAYWNAANKRWSWE
jgi:hypothetical protein